MANTPVKNGAMIRCSMGTAPVQLTVLPPNTLANIADSRPFLNIRPFGMCTSMANPMVAGATAATGGAFTPMSCLPTTISHWMPGDPGNMEGGLPSLTMNSCCICAYGGTITVLTPGT